MQYLVTITDNISPTSMPYNEFVLYRNRIYYEEKQIVVLLFKSSVNHHITFLDNLELHVINQDWRKLKRLVCEINTRAENDNASLIFHIHEAKSVLFFSIATGLRYSKSIVYTLHSTYSHYPLHNKLFSISATILSDHVVCVSQTAYNHFPGWLKSLNSLKINVIQNGVDCGRINQTLANVQDDVCSANKEKLRLIYVARLIPLKKHEILFNALRYLPECTLTLIGEGIRCKELKSLAEEFGIKDRIIFLGLCRRNDVFIEIKKHDIYVSSSSYEGLPISLLEAMSCGVVCVVSDIEQHREIKEKCPSLITVNNRVEEWVKAIQKIAAMSTEERTKVGNQNKKDVDQYFSLARMHAQYDKVYDEVSRGIT